MHLLNLPTLPHLQDSVCGVACKTAVWLNFLWEN